MKNSNERMIMLLDICIKEFKNINKLLDECFTALEQNTSVDDRFTDK